MGVDEQRPGESSWNVERGGNLEHRGRSARLGKAAVALVGITDRETVEALRLRPGEAGVALIRTGDRVAPRGFALGGRERVVSWSLLTTDRSDPRSVNYLDLLAYRYVNCLFGPLH